MWHSRNDNDILDFALLWEPIGGPGPDHVAAAFSIDLREYHRRVRDAARLQLAHLQECANHPDRVYALSALTAFDRDPPPERVERLTSAH